MVKIKRLRNNKVLVSGNTIDGVADEAIQLVKYDEYEIDKPLYTSFWSISPKYCVRLRPRTQKEKDADFERKMRWKYMAKLRTTPEEIKQWAEWLLKARKRYYGDRFYQVFETEEKGRRL